MLTYKEEPIDKLIDNRLSMSCEYMLKYQFLIEWFISSYIVQLPLFYN